MNVVRKLLLLLVACLLASLLSGCDGSEVAIVNGTATFNGSPLPEGTRVFFEQPGTGYVAAAIVKADGSFALNYQGDPKVMPGEYQVFIGPPPSDMSPAEFEALKKKVAAEYRKRGKKPPLSPDWVLPNQFYSVATSPLSETVAPGENQVALVLEE